MRTRMKTLLLTVLAVLTLTLALPRTVAAQAITSYTFKVLNGTTVVSTTNIPLTSFVCGQTPKVTVSGAPTNPKQIVIDDPASPTTADCIYTDPGTGPLSALPFGPMSYSAVIEAVNSSGLISADDPSVDSFTRPGTAAPVPTGLRVK